MRFGPLGTAAQWISPRNLGELTELGSRLSRSRMRARRVGSWPGRSVGALVPRVPSEMGSRFILPILTRFAVAGRVRSGLRCSSVTVSLRIKKRGRLLVVVLSYCILAFFRVTGRTMPRGRKARPASGFGLRAVRPPRIPSIVPAGTPVILSGGRAANLSYVVQ